MGTPLGTVIGALIGIIATVLVSRYYFLRSTKKELSAYRLLTTHVFGGIEPSVRQRLRFTFEDKEVREISQLGVLIANSGERAISGFIEPPTIELPKGLSLLDASIEYRQPQSLEAAINAIGNPSSGVTVQFDVPLLNKGEFFVVKLLVGGTLSFGGLHLKLLAPDLPRQIPFAFLPYQATQQKSPKIDWSAVVVGVFIMSLAYCSGFALYLLRICQPALFLIPWSTFNLSIAALLIQGAVGVVGLFALIGLAFTVGAGFSDVLLLRPRFPLPPEIGRGQIFSPFAYDESAPAEGDRSDAADPPSTKGDEAGRGPTGRTGNA